jgi:hypothetical protein
VAYLAQLLRLLLERLGGDAMQIQHLDGHHLLILVMVMEDGLVDRAVTTSLLVVTQLAQVERKSNAKVTATVSKDAPLGIDDIKPTTGIARLNVATAGGGEESMVA